ncbi:MAG: DUF4180 domain-containing protein [bacterium]|jgi:hypothetical protein|nr:hypothetical protein [Syntrophomonas sp.]
MKYQILESHGKRYLYFASSDSLIQREQDANDIISLCAEHNTNAVVLDGNILSDDFIKLRTGLAGAVLQGNGGRYLLGFRTPIKVQWHLGRRFLLLTYVQNHIDKYRYA